jgi:hypothetical protein
MMPYHRMRACNTRARNVDNQPKVHILHKSENTGAQWSTLGGIVTLRHRNYSRDALHEASISTSAA